MNEVLIEKYNRLVESKVPAKYYHLKTTYNLIFHLESLQNGRKKEEMFQMLNDYLDYLEVNDVTTAQESLMNYNHFLRPISIYYEKKLGFMYFAKWRVLLLFILVPSAVMCFFLDSILSLGLLVMIDVVVLTFFYQKYKAKKTYGYMW